MEVLKKDAVISFYSSGKHTERRYKTILTSLRFKHHVPRIRSYILLPYERRNVFRIKRPNKFNQKLSRKIYWALENEVIVAATMK